jgi:hypothetical protein
MQLFSGTSPELPYSNPQATYFLILLTIIELVDFENKYCLPYS